MRPCIECVTVIYPVKSVSRFAWRVFNMAGMKRNAADGLFTKHSWLSGPPQCMKIAPCGLRAVAWGALFTAKTRVAN
ncbi:MAG: hypothetical protein JW882_10890 [Deltaproteobacteria bacterium]|nr:hypothetical protein [Deltaproteobacteria bacterium]